MTHLIDVHVLHSQHEYQPWWEQCLQSLQNQPINIFELDGIPGDIRQARYNGFTQGTAPYVSFVDPDDFVYPDTYQKCLEELQLNPHVCGVYTMSHVIRDDQVDLMHEYRPWSLELHSTNICEVHQVTVMKRELVLDCYKQCFDDIPLHLYNQAYLYLHLAQHSPWKAINHIGYGWRDHNGGNHNIRIHQFPDGLMKLQNQVYNRVLSERFIRL